MGPFEMIVALVAIKTGADIVKTIARRREKQLDTRMVAEVEALRSEVRELRRQHQDTILSFDSTLDRFDRRMDRLEAPPREANELPGNMERLSGREPVSAGLSYR